MLHDAIHQRIALPLLLPAGELPLQVRHAKPHPDQLMQRLLCRTRTRKSFSEKDFVPAHHRPDAGADPWSVVLLLDIPEAVGGGEDPVRVDQRTAAERLPLPALALVVYERRHEGECT